MSRDTLLTIDKMGEKSIQNLFDAIEKSKVVTLHRFIYALGIRGVGETTAKLDKAKTLNITVIDEAQFLALLEQYQKE